MVQMGINLNSIMLKVSLKEMLSIMLLVGHLKKEHIGNDDKSKVVLELLFRLLKCISHKRSQK